MKAIFCALVVSLCCTFALGQAQYTVIWNFAGVPNDGAVPTGSLISDRSGNLYGTTSGGGSGRSIGGTVFELSPNGDGTWSETVLYNFCSRYVDRKCEDGATPKAGLTFDRRGNLYGTTLYGGTQKCPFNTNGCGTVFELLPQSRPGVAWAERVLYNFCMIEANNLCMDGAAPLSQLTIDSSGNLYGTTSVGGTGQGSGGTVFELSRGSGGVTHTILYSFCSLGQGSICPDGNMPVAGVTFDSAGNLYGTTKYGGTFGGTGAGTLYKLSSGSSGWTETVLIGLGAPPKGNAPLGSVALDKVGNVYGTFFGGGVNNAGGMFKYSSKNRKTEIYSFNGANGAESSAGILLAPNNATLYGTTSQGGMNQAGVVFAMTAGAEEKVLYSFCSQPNCIDGVAPTASVIQDTSGNIYGTASLGGANGQGVVFEITP